MELVLGYPAVSGCVKIPDHAGYGQGENEELGGAGAGKWKSWQAGRRR